MGADALTLSEVAPFVPVTGGYNSNFFSGRVYDPQAIYTDSTVVTIVFAGYNTPQPSNNLGDYRSIGRFQVQARRAGLPVLIEVPETRRYPQWLSNNGGSMAANIGGGLKFALPSGHMYRGTD